MKIRTLTPGERAEMVILRTIHDAHEKWRDGRTSYKSEECPVNLRMTNEQRSRLEILSFLDSPPEKYFAYVHTLGGVLITITTWVGDTLGDVTWHGDSYSLPAFNGGRSVRQNFRFLAISGHEYSGTYYKSSGNYCRVRRIKK